MLNALLFVAPLAFAPPLSARARVMPFREPRLLFACAAPEESAPLPLGARLKAAQSSLTSFLDKRFFLVGVVVSVALAAAFPSVGRRGGPLRPELTVAWGATCSIFLLAGLSLPTSELTRAGKLCTILHRHTPSYTVLHHPVVL